MAEGTLLSVGIHGLSDFARDCISGFVAGLALMVIGAYRTHRRRTSERLNRHAVEIRHTQKETNVEPFYPGEL